MTEYSSSFKSDTNLGLAPQSSSPSAYVGLMSLAADVCRSLTPLEGIVSLQGLMNPSHSPSIDVMGWDFIFVIPKPGVQVHSCTIYTCSKSHDVSI